MTKPESHVRAVVFDLDGLMFNTEEVFYRAGQELLARRGLEYTDELSQLMMGRRAPESFTALVKHLGIDETAEMLQAESEVIFERLLHDFLAPMPGLFELLDEIEARKLPKAVATSSSRRYMEELLTRFDLLGRFTTTLTAEDVTHGKPHPEIYQTAAARLELAPRETLVLEDSETGSRAAAAAGAVVVSVPHEYSRRHCFDFATHIATSLADPHILTLLDGRG